MTRPMPASDRAIPRLVESAAIEGQANHPRKSKAASVSKLVNVAVLLIRSVAGRGISEESARIVPMSGRPLRYKRFSMFRRIGCALTCPACLRGPHDRWPDGSSRTGPKHLRALEVLGRYSCYPSPRVSARSCRISLVSWGHASSAYVHSANLIISGILATFRRNISSTNFAISRPQTPSSCTTVRIHPRSA